MAIVKKENILLLIHGSELVDSSLYNHTITNSGVVIDDTQKHFSQYGSLKWKSGSYHCFTVSNLISGTMDYTLDF